MSYRRLTISLATVGMLGSALPALLSAHAAGALPQGYPTPGCFTMTDPQGDAHPDNQANLPYDPDLDILGAAWETTATDLKVYVKVAQLADGPATTDGHRYAVTFGLNGHVFTLAGSHYANGTGAIRDGASQTGLVAGVNQFSEDSPSLTAVPPPTDRGFRPASVSFTWDTKNSWVIADVPIADIVKQAGAPFTGTLKGVGVSAATDEYAVSSIADTTASDNSQNYTATWTVGDNHCFGPPNAVLTSAGATAVEYSDGAAVAAKLVSASGSPLSGESVTFAVGNTQVTATTNSSGIAHATLNPGLTAGSYSLVTSFAGTTTDGPATVTTPFTVSTEKTALKLSDAAHAKARTITATLRDDSGQPVAGGVVDWFVNGKSVGSSKTSSSGTAALRTTAGARVTATFNPVTGKYAGSSANRTA